MNPSHNHNTSGHCRIIMFCPTVRPYDQIVSFQACGFFLFGYQRSCSSSFNTNLTSYNFSDLTRIGMTSNFTKEIISLVCLFLQCHLSVPFFLSQLQSFLEYVNLIYSVMIHYVSSEFYTRNSTVQISHRTPNTLAVLTISPLLHKKYLLD